MLIAGNWKMNKSVKETIDFFKSFNELAAKSKNQVLICPSFPCIPAAREAASKKISIGAQNVFFEEKGEFTGEVSVSQLSPFCDFIILGHSDRRHKFSESNELINKKLKKAVKSKFSVILCIGETLKERGLGETNSVLEKQLTECLQDVSLEKLFIAYEPVWAIGTGKNSSKKDILEVNSFIKEKLVSLFGEKGKEVKILYGGSVKPENSDEILSISNVDGVLVGGASLDPKKFAIIANYEK
jgi:triosephosphate isomerase